MTIPTEVIARIAASLARREEEDKRIAERSKAYTGPERRRGRQRAQESQPVTSIKEPA
jgi:hypothetical protein